MNPDEIRADIAGLRWWVWHNLGAGTPEHQGLLEALAELEQARRRNTHFPPEEAK